jgi:perosamine synthetase
MTLRENLFCNDKTSLIDAWKLINENGKNTVFIVDDHKKLCGLLTDGDIRRHLLKGGKLDILAGKIMNTRYVYANDQESHTQLIEKATDSVKIIPIINVKGELVDYFEYTTSFHIPVALPNLSGKEFDYLMDAFLSTWISSSGSYIKKFEDQFSTYSDCKYGVAVSNGTVALHLALVTLGIGKGDEVIVPDLTFAATINTVLHANATPVIVDIEKESWCIDPREIEKAITPKTKAIVPVHLYGQPCDMDAIMKIAEKHKLFVVEDCAEAHGAQYKGQKVGSFGDIGCYSFYGNKVITTGEGGMCVTNNLQYDEKMRVLRDHGMSKTRKYWHEYIGYNYRMTNLQAAIGLAQLERIDEIHEDREKIESNYLKELSSIPDFEFQKTNLPNRKKITWLVCALITKNRDEFLFKLQENGIEVRPFFYSLGDMDLYKKYVFSNKVSKEISTMGINFPTNNTVNKRVLNRIKQILTKENE